MAQPTSEPENRSRADCSPAHSGVYQRIRSVKHIPFYDYTNVTKFKQCIEIFKTYLVNISNAPYFKNPENSDLLNIRDEILGDLNKFTYLLTFH